MSRLNRETPCAPLRGIMGTKKTAVFVALVIVMATISGMTYGALF
jgi:uncharacterized protein